MVLLGIPLLALLVAGLFVAGASSRSPRLGLAIGAGTASWLALTAVVARAGVLARFDARPPPMALMFVGVVALGVGLGVSKVGARYAELPIWLLVLAQGFGDLLINTVFLDRTASVKHQDARLKGDQFL